MVFLEPKPADRNLGLGRLRVFSHNSVFQSHLSCHTIMNIKLCILAAFCVVSVAHCLNTTTIYRRTMPMSSYTANQGDNLQFTCPQGCFCKINWVAAQCNIVPSAWLNGNITTGAGTVTFNGYDQRQSAMLMVFNAPYSTVYGSFYNPSSGVMTCNPAPTWGWEETCPAASSNNMLVAPSSSGTSLQPASLTALLLVLVLWY